MLSFSSLILLVLVGLGVDITSSHFVIALSFIFICAAFGLWEIGESTHSSTLFVPSERTKAPHREPSRKRPSLSPNGPSSLPEKLTSSIWPWSDEAALHCGKTRFERKHHTFLSPKSVFEMWVHSRQELISLVEETSE